MGEMVSNTWSSKAFWTTTAVLPFYVYLGWTAIEELLLGKEGLGSGRYHVVAEPGKDPKLSIVFDALTIGYTIALVGATIALAGALRTYWNAALKKPLPAHVGGWFLQVAGLVICFLSTLFIVQPGTL